MPKRRRRRTAKKHLDLLKTTRPYYESNLARQGGTCALCPRTPDKRRLDTDHNHATMMVRGLLCVPCNRALRDWMDAEWLRRAANYVENPPWRFE